MEKSDTEKLSERQDLDLYPLDYDKIPLFAKKMPTFFCFNKDIELNSYMNWRTSFAGSQRKHLVIIGKGYFDTAHFLLAECIENNNFKIADYWIFPILFNVIHAIEIYLKAINASYNILLDKGIGRIEGKHDIRQLCSIAKSQLEEFKKENNDTTIDEFIQCIKLVMNFIENIYQKTNDMTFARYPMDKDKNGHFYIQKLENETIDMTILFEQIPYVYKSLDYIFFRSEDYIEWKSEMEQEYREIESYYNY